MLKNRLDDMIIANGYDSNVTVTIAIAWIGKLKSQYFYSCQYDLTRCDNC